MYEKCVMCNIITPRIWIQKTNSNEMIYTLTSFLCVKVCGAGRQKKEEEKGEGEDTFVCYLNRLSFPFLNTTFGRFCADVRYLTISNTRCELILLYSTDIYLRVSQREGRRRERKTKSQKWNQRMTNLPHSSQ